MFNIEHLSHFSQRLCSSGDLTQRRISLAIVLAVFVLFISPTPLWAQSETEQFEAIGVASSAGEAMGTTVLQPTYFRGVVTEVIEQNQLSDDPPLYSQLLAVQLENGQTIVISAGSELQPLFENQLLKTQMGVIVAQEQSGDVGTRWVLADVNRLPVVFWVVLIFVVVVVAVARWQGLFALIGMAISLAILLQYTVPSILSGSNPFWVSLVSCVVIATMTLYVAHGWSVKSHIALVSILITLFGVALFSLVAVEAASLLGLGSEEAFFLQYGQTAVIDLQGLLLGGILLGALGVLDDIAISQSAIVLQLAKANKKLSAKELFLRGMHVGRDHIASLVNTLFLAYIGANTALFILFYINEQTPFWVALNSELIVEEIIRTISGSLGLVLAVPLTSALAALAVHYWPKEAVRAVGDNSHDEHRH